MATTVVNFVFESGISLIVFTLVYLFLLRRETFFLLNRIYLMGAVAVSILLPFIHIPVTIQMEPIILGEVVVTAKKYQNLLETVTVYGNKITGNIEQAIQSIGIIRIIYLTGVFLFAILFIYRILQIIILISGNETEEKNGVTTVKINQDITPFSFFNYVFIRGNHQESPGMEEMFAHEMEHVRQGHSFDVLILELLTIFQWFNPFIWLLKRSVRENHEFLADNGVLKPGVNSANYRLLLLNSSFIQQPFIANNFNYSLIKIRIKMISKIKSPKTAALKLTMGILVTAALLIVFGFDNYGSIPQQKKTITTQTKESQKPNSSENQVFVQVEQMPVFPGGELALRDFIAKAVKYPDDAIKAGTQGKVFITFVINKNGKVSDAKVVRGVSKSLDEEALRVINSNNMPKWIPGKQKGKNVAVSYTVPINFALK